MIVRDASHSPALIFLLLVMKPTNYLWEEKPPSCVACWFMQPVTQSWLVRTLHPCGLETCSRKSDLGQINERIKGKKQHEAGVARRSLEEKNSIGVRLT